MDFMSTAQLLGNFGEFVGAIAVVATLGYLAIQIRQNTRSSSVSRGQAAQHQLAQMHEQIMGNKELADLVARCRSLDLGDLSPGDHERVRRVANYYINSYVNVENVYRLGEFDQREYDTYCQDFRRTVVDYPALKPEMITIMEHFDTEYYQIVRPLFE